MDCEHYEELLSAALDGELSAEEQRELDEHLARCPACAALFDELSAQCAALRELDCQFPDGLHERILDRLPPQQEKTPNKKLIPWRRWGALAACLVLVTAAAFALPRLSGQPTGTAPISLTDGTLPIEDNSLDRSGQPALYSDEADCFTAARSVEETGDEAFPDADIEAYAAPQSEPDFYAFQNDQYIRVTCGSTPSPSARIIGSVQSLEGFLAQFPEDDLSKIAVEYGEDYFASGRILAVVLEEPSGSITHRLNPQGLSRYQVSILRREPEEKVGGMAAWLILAEVDDVFSDGDELSTALIPWEE